MEKLEKVCKGLALCSAGTCVGSNCPYYHDVLKELKEVDCNTELAIDALSMIRQQQDRIEELEEAQRVMVYQDCLRPEWISVKDILPERPENWPHCEIKRCYFLVALESGCVKSLGFDFADMRWHTTGSPVTHWMPLPEPPKEGSTDETHT
jgi:hypothetical protein